MLSTSFGGLRLPASPKIIPLFCHFLFQTPQNWSDEPYWLKKLTANKRKNVMATETSVQPNELGMRLRLRKYLAVTVQGRFLLGIAALIGLLCVPLLTRADRGSGFDPKENRLEGTWLITARPILPPGVPPIEVRTYATFAAGGVSIGSDRTKPFASPQHGTWAHLGGHDYAWTWAQDVFDASGAFLSVFKGRNLVRIIGENELSGVANVEYRDAAGNLLANRCARFSATRLMLEPLAAPCDDLQL